jgi:hypothetical protein
MRHYGVPTRLLDWTQSFYVALYFAASRQPSKDGALYALHAHTLHAVMQDAHGSAANVDLANLSRQLIRADAPPVVTLYNRRTALLDRMIVQQGAFMCCSNIGGEIEALISTEMHKVANPTMMNFHKFRIPASLKTPIMRKLRSMNITGSSLFPGLDGIGRQLDELVRFRS